MAPPTVYCAFRHHPIHGRVRLANGAFKETLDQYCHHKNISPFALNSKFCEACRRAVMNFVKRELPLLEDIANEDQALVERDEAFDDIPLNDVPAPSNEATFKDAKDATVSTANATDTTANATNTTANATNTTANSTNTPANGPTLDLTINEPMMEEPPVVQNETVSGRECTRESFSENQSRRKRRRATVEEDPDAFLLMNVEAEYSQVDSEDMSGSANAAQQKMYFSEVHTIPTATQSTCFICMLKKKKDPAYLPASKNRYCLEESAWKDIWITEELYIPKSLRTCGLHYDADKRFDKEAKDVLYENQIQEVYLDAETICCLMHVLRHDCNHSCTQIIEVESTSLTDADFLLFFKV